MDVLDARAALPEPFALWFSDRGWRPRPHQLDLLRRAEAGRSVLLIAPTGAGKTLAGFLPSLIDLTTSATSPEASRPPTPLPDADGSTSLAERLARWKRTERRGIHTLYVSPLKALAVDVARNVEMPVAEMGLDIIVETRTGDTNPSKRQRQKTSPPDILMTTPEQVALLLASREAADLFSGLKTVILDELHALVTSKRGHLLALDLARLRAHAPDVRTIGLSATVAQPEDLRAWLVPQRPDAGPVLADIVEVAGGTTPEISILNSDERIPWSGHSARYALPDLYGLIGRHQMTLVFVNTRSQAEMLFQQLWNLNEDNLAIALHHGSLSPEQRRKVEAAMAAGKLKAVVCTSTLDLGIDWGDVDLVVHVGAPKGASRLAQRIGRANHRMDEPSRAVLVPANRFEVMECQAALDANYLGAQDTPPLRSGALDVLAQHVLGVAVAGPFDPDALFAEVTSALPYKDLPRSDFDRVVDFVATGGYALKSYDRFARLKQTGDGRFRIAHPSVAQTYRLNVGTIVEAPMLKVRLARARKNPGPVRGGRVLGQIEEYFIETLAAGDTFLFAGEVLKLEAIVEDEAIVSRATSIDPKVPAYMGGKFPLSTYLADQVRGMLGDPQSWSSLPDQVGEWLRMQKLRSILPERGEMLVETFPRGTRHYLVAYPFEGRLAHQTLGMLLTRRLERARARPLGFVATDYAMAVWALDDIGARLADGDPSPAQLFHQDMLGDDLEAWMAESYMLKRTFRQCAVIAGLIERRFPGKEKTGRQVTVSTDLIYDVLRRHEPDHILLKATWDDAATGLLDIARVGAMLSRIEGRIVHKRLERISPLAVPVMLEIGKEPVYGEANDTLMAEAADDLIEEAMTP